MIDLKWLADNVDIAKKSQIDRNENPELIDQILDADRAYKDCLTNFENKRAEQNKLGKEVAKADPETRQELLKNTKELSIEVQNLKELSENLFEQREDLLYQLPNIIEGAPPGGEEDYKVLETKGELPKFDFEVKDHLDLGELTDTIDTQRGAKVGGSRFYFLKGLGARLEIALLNLAISEATKNGFVLMNTPTLVLPEIMSGTGFLGKHSAEIYRLREPDENYLVGTSEVALAGYHKDEIINLDQPLLYAGFSSCFRREAGSYGKDTRGIIRVHQFNKVEMFAYCKPSDAEEIHQKMLAMEKSMIEKMELPYRVLDIAAGDLGSSAARKFDCEGWLPSQNRYLELTSTSNCTTFQARRLNIRYKDQETDKNQIAATLNGTLATTRWIVSIFENHQNPDGSINIPKALQEYLGTDLIPVAN